jgi:hypothetical protein
MSIHLTGPVLQNMNNYPVVIDTYVGYNPERGIIICPGDMVKEINWYDGGAAYNTRDKVYYKGFIRVEHEEGEEVIEFTDLILFYPIKD